MTGEIRLSGSPATIAAQPKVFGLFSMTLFSVAAILVGDTVATSAALGVQGLSWWVILGLLFFVPYGFIAAELGSAWPDQGGAYAWIREAYGPMMASISAWLFWVNTAYWIPSAFVLFAGALATVFWESISRTQEMIVVLVLIWVIVGVGVLPLRLSKWVPNVTAVVKVVILLALGIVGVAFAIKNGSANSFDLAQWKPTWSGGNWQYLPIVLYSYMGFELMNAAGGAIKNPTRDVPKMIALAGVLIVGVYMFATVGILGSLPLDDVSIVTGIADALKLGFVNVLGGYSWLYEVFMVALLFTFVGSVFTWALACNQMMATTGLDKSAPAVFGHVHPRFKTPDYSFYLMGVIASAVAILNYALFADNEDVFWTVFSLSSVVYLLPYLLLFPALLVLRAKQPDKPRPYRVPMGAFGAWLSVILCTSAIFFAFCLFFYGDGTAQWTYWAITGGGMVISVLVGWLLYKRARVKE